MADASSGPVSDATYVAEDNRVVQIVLPDYRKCYAPNDFTDSRCRSLDRAVADYVSKLALRPLWKGPRKMVLRISGKVRDARQEDLTVDAYRRLFAWRGTAAVRKFLGELPLAFTLVAIGVCVLWLSNRVDDAMHMEENVRSTLSDVVQVGAWVALWSAISLLFSTGFTSLANYVAFRRLARIPIEFEYDAEGIPAKRRRTSKTLKHS